jgi:hypothetical protein
MRGFKLTDFLAAYALRYAVQHFAARFGDRRVTVFTKESTRCGRVLDCYSQGMREIFLNALLYQIH